jgi:hypothetical protein
MRRRARVSRSESTSPARVLLASGERDGDGAGSPSLPPPATTTTTTTTTTTSKTFAVDAADAAALVADLVVARADADLADVLATSLTVAIEVEESGAREAGGVGDGERAAVLCELVLDRTNEARGSARRWRPTAPHCTATRVVDETTDEATDRADVLRVEASLSPRRHPAVRLAAVTLTRTTTLVGAKPAASTNPSLPSLPPSPPLDVRAVAVVTGEDVDALARAWLARAARCAADALPATVAACGRMVPFPFFPGDGAGDALVVAVVDDARLRGCCAATRVYHAEECACALDVFDVASDVASDLVSHAEEGSFTRDDNSDDAGLNGVPLAFPPLGSVDADDRTLAIALHRLCAASDAPADSCVASSAVMTAASASAARLLSGTRGGDRTSLAAQSSGAASDMESDVAHDVASDVASFLSWLDGDARETRPEVFTRSTASAAPPPRPRPPPSPLIPPPPPPPPTTTTTTTATATTTATNTTTTATKNTTTTATKNWHPDGAFFAVVVVALLVAGLFVVVVCVRLARRWRATSGGDDVGGTGIADEEGEGGDEGAAGGEVLLVRRRATPHPGKP